MAKNLRMKVLSEEEISTIHDKCMLILSSKGVKAAHPQILEILARAGASVDFDSQQIRFPKDVIETALKSVPRSLTLAGNKVIPHPRGTFYVCTETGADTFVDPDSNNHRSVMLADIEMWGQLIEKLDGIDVGSFLAPADAPPETADIHALKALFENLSKPIILQPYSFNSLEYLFELVQVIQDTQNIKEQPLVCTICVPVSPFVYKAMDMEAILQTCRRGQIVLAPSLSCGGTTAPVTIAGQVLLSVVEILATTVMSQLIKPGTPVITNPFLTRLDMSSGRNLQSTVESILANVACCQVLIDAYKLPTAGQGLGTDSHVIDEQSSIESSMLGLQNAMAGCDILIQAGSLSTAKTVSPVKLVLDSILAGMLKRTVTGVDVNDETLAWKELFDIEPGSIFLKRRHTLQHFRDYSKTELFENEALALWKSKGSRDLYSKALDSYRDVSKKLESRPLPEHVQKELNLIVEKADAKLVK